MRLSEIRTFWRRDRTAALASLGVGTVAFVNATVAYAQTPGDLTAMVAANPSPLVAVIFTIGLIATQILTTIRSGRNAVDGAKDREIADLKAALEAARREGAEFKAREAAAAMKAQILEELRAEAREASEG